jgi:hypothetical protein
LGRYYVSDPYLRFWLRFVDGQLSTVQRGRGEPIVRSAIERLLPDERFGEALFVGRYWSRDSSIEVDRVGGQKADIAGPVEFVGSVKWRGHAPFGRGDLTALANHRDVLPGATAETRLVGVSLTGFAVEGLDVALGADDVVAAYPAARLDVHLACAFGLFVCVAQVAASYAPTEARPEQQERERERRRGDEVRRERPDVRLCRRRPGWAAPQQPTRGGCNTGDVVVGERPES